jgi:dipeptidyl aminopeptidase/acylaminoacyl peptidase
LTSEETQNLLRTAIQAAQGGNKAIARHILEQVIDQDPNNELAWIWMASVAETLDERRNCLQKVLAINPKNERAKQALAKVERTAASPAPSAPPSQTPRLEEAPAELRVRRTQDMEREALLKAHARRRQGGLSPVLFAAVAVLAVIMIAAGLILLWDNMQSDKKTTEATAVPFPTGQTQFALFPTSTPFGGTLRTLPPRETLPSTWTPTATWTPTNTPLPTATALPLASYALIASFRQGDDAQWMLYTLLADGSGMAEVSLRLAAADGTLAGVFDAAFSPDGSQIAFTGIVSVATSEAGTELPPRQFEEIFIAPAAGGEMRRVTTFEAANTEDVTWSPDGLRIAFASDTDGDFDIYVLPVDGGTPVPMTRNSAEDRDPAWSPDGLTIVFSSDQSAPGALEVWRVSTDGSSTKQLTENVNSSYAPAWSPDGQSIVFLSNRRVNTDLYIMTADGAGERAVLVRDVDSEERDPAWSPDGQWIAFSSNRERAGYDLYVIRPDGTDLQRLTDGTHGDARFVAWQP